MDLSIFTRGFAMFKTIRSGAVSVLIVCILFSVLGSADAANERRPVRDPGGMMPGQGPGMPGMPSMPGMGAMKGFRQQAGEKKKKNKKGKKKGPWGGGYF